MTFNFYTPFEIAQQIAFRAKEKRLSFNLTQQSLAERADVSLSVLKKFERTGKISLESMLKLALVLESLNDFAEVFKKKTPESFLTLEKLLQQKNRKRGRQ